jgi:hypothetical protein
MTSTKKAESLDFLVYVTYVKLTYGNLESPKLVNTVRVKCSPQKETKSYLSFIKKNFKINKEDVVYNTLTKWNTWSVSRGKKYALLKTKEKAFLVDMEKANSENDYKNKFAYKKYGETKVVFRLESYGGVDVVYRLNEEYPSTVIWRNELSFQR